MLTTLRDKLKPIGRFNALGDVVKRAKEYLDGLPKELLTASRLLQESLIFKNLGDALRESLLENGKWRSFGSERAN
jgi:hypothetical protein